MNVALLCANIQPFASDWQMNTCYPEKKTSHSLIIYKNSIKIIKFCAKMYKINKFNLKVDTCNFLGNQQEFYYLFTVSGIFASKRT